MENRTELSRGDARRNDRRRRLREVVSRERAICGIDLADEVQELVVTDHDGTVLARRGLKHRRAWQRTDALVWAHQQARVAGFDGMVVACEPTGHRWRVVTEQCHALKLDVVCVQPLLVHRERERDDLTRDRSDQRDAVLIADLAAQLRCYIPNAPTRSLAGGLPRQPGHPGLAWVRGQPQLDRLGLSIRLGYEFSGIDLVASIAPLHLGDRAQRRAQRRHETVPWPVGVGHDRQPTTVRAGCARVGGLYRSSPARA